jgi:glutamine cyclotransferase
VWSLSTAVRCCWTSAGAYAALLVFRNPYIYAVLTVVTILPQNSNVTSLNNLVLLFYESGLFMNFAEAVTCVRLVTWLSMGFMVASFALLK